MRFARSIVPGAALLVSAALGIAASTASAQTYVFGRADFATGNNPVAVAVGDFNGDGKLDLAVANQSDNTVSVLLGQPNGTFGPKTDFSVGASPSALAAADFNLDGKLDLAVASNADNTVSILLGNGDGTFQAATNYGTGSGPSSVAAGDFNGDGKPDLAVANSGSASVSVLLNNGDGTFAPRVDYATGNGPASVAAADFNADGNLDLAVSNETDGTVSVLLGKGNGTFQTAVSYSGGGTCIAVGDFNGDGRPDLAVALSGGFGYLLSVLLGNGDGTFQAAGYQPSIYSAYSVAVGDLNRDGRLDVVEATSSGVVVWLGNGDGSFQQPPFAEAPPATYGVASASVAVGDFNGDGGLDVAVTNSGSGTVSILLGDFDGTFEHEKQTFVGDHYYEFGQAADFNADGTLDLAVPFVNQGYCFGTVCSGVSILLGNGDGTFQGGSSYATGPEPDSVTIGDFNGDGNSDLAVTDGLVAAVSILLGNGDGTFQAAVNYAASNGPVAVGDFNRDGRLDLAVIGGPPNCDLPQVAMFSILLGNGDGTFQGALTYCGNSSFSSLAVGDFNGDGKLDLAMTNAGVSVLLGNGDGTFQAAVNYSAGLNPSSVAVGDFNRDGKLDLAVGGSGNVSVLLGNGNGTFAPAVTYTVPAAASMAVADFAGDGILDIAVPGSILFGEGDGTFQAISGPNFSIGGGSPSLMIGDFDGDGTVDLAGTNLPGDGLPPSVEVFLNKPVIALYPDQLTFPDQTLGVTSAAETVTISNPGLASLTISSIAATGDFAQTNDCNSALTGGTQCSVAVTFTPISSGTSTGSITITDNAPGSPHVIVLAGTSGAMVSVTPASLSFGDQPAGTTGPAQTVTLSNTGTAALTVTSISASGDYSETNTCGASVAAGASCTLRVSFTPTATGTRTGTITITDNAPGSPQIVSLTGTGTAPVVTFSTETVSVGGQVVGTTSAAQTVTLTNTGNAALNITGVAITPAAFTETNKCGTSLAAGASCTITVAFTPSSAGEVSGTLTITDNAFGSPHRVSLSGVGQDFSIGPYNLSATVIPGATTSCAFQVAPLGGFNQTVSLACSGAPQEATCTLNPTSVALDGRNFAAIGLQLSTTAPTSGGARGGRWPVLPPSREWFVAMGATMLLGLLGLLGRASHLVRLDWEPQAQQLRLRILTLSGVLLLATIGWAACGGGSTPTVAPPTGGTPAGNYTLTVTATSGHLTHSSTVKLTVQ